MIISTIPGIHTPLQEIVVSLGKMELCIFFQYRNISAGSKTGDLTPRSHPTLLRKYGYEYLV
jgi:hypothetical protein